MSSKQLKHSLIKWDIAIKDAQKHIERLRTVIVICEERKAAGAPWPGRKELGLSEAATHN